ncbi:hypothetical protein KGY64_04175 [Candidatus Bipolaricaulota bacterium]|nr:hypothetical protein [Candidatus Bipolaricaulota bacterium]
MDFSLGELLFGVGGLLVGIGALIAFLKIAQVTDSFVKEKEKNEGDN